MENLFLSPDAYYMKCWRSKEINVTFNLFVQNASCNLLLNVDSVLSQLTMVKTIVVLYSKKPVQKFMTMNSVCEELIVLIVDFLCVQKSNL